MPVYAANRTHWTEAFTSRLSESVKLVGPTINCGAGPNTEPKAHVQSFVVATDRVGLQVGGQSCSGGIGQASWQSQLAGQAPFRGVWARPGREHATVPCSSQVLLDRGTVFKCHDGWEDAIQHGEVGASQAIYDAGFTIASLLVRYQVSCATLGFGVLSRRSCIHAFMRSYIHQSRLGLSGPRVWSTGKKKKEWATCLVHRKRRKRKKTRAGSGLE